MVGVSAQVYAASVQVVHANRERSITPVKCGSAYMWWQGNPPFSLSRTWQMKDRQEYKDHCAFAGLGEGDKQAGAVGRSLSVPSACGHGTKAESRDGARV